MEDAKPALQLEADDEGRCQAVELGEALPAAEELRLSANLSTLLADDGAGEHLPGSFSSSDSVQKEPEGAFSFQRIGNGLRKPLGALDWPVKCQEEL